VTKWEGDWVRNTFKEKTFSFKEQKRTYSMKLRTNEGGKKKSGEGGFAAYAIGGGENRVPREKMSSVQAGHGFIGIKTMVRGSGLSHISQRKSYPLQQGQWASAVGTGKNTDWFGGVNLGQKNEGLHRKYRAATKEEFGQVGVTQADNKGTRRLN